MVLKEKINEMYPNIMDKLFANMEGFSLSSYADKLFMENVPSYARRYTQPERVYVKRVASGLDPYINELISNAHVKLRESPEKARYLTLDELVRFSDREKQEEFCNKVKEGIEDLAYASEVASVEAYNILEVKANTPIIGYFVKKELKKKFGSSSLPERGLVKQMINYEKSGLFDLLKSYDSKFKLKESSSEEISRRYNMRMHGVSDYRRLLAYDIENNFIDPNMHILDKNLKNLNKKDRFKMEMKYARSEYNGFFESVVGFVGSAFNYLFR
jgi:hypothetical protein